MIFSQELENLKNWIYWEGKNLNYWEFETLLAEIYFHPGVILPGYFNFMHWQFLGILRQDRNHAICNAHSSCHFLLKKIPSCIIYRNKNFLHYISCLRFFTCVQNDMRGQTENFDNVVFCNRIFILCIGNFHGFYGKTIPLVN